MYAYADEHGCCGVEGGCGGSLTGPGRRGGSPGARCRRSLAGTGQASDMPVTHELRATRAGQNARTARRMVMIGVPRRQVGAVPAEGARPRSCNFRPPHNAQVRLRSSHPAHAADLLQTSQSGVPTAVKAQRSSAPAVRSTPAASVFICVPSAFICVPLSTSRRKHAGPRAASQAAEHPGSSLISGNKVAGDQPSPPPARAPARVQG